MPTSAKRRCGKCKRVVHGACPDCTKQREAARNERRPEQLKVYKSDAFQRLREVVYERDASICAWCGQVVSWKDYHCDHRVDISVRPDLAYDEDNLQTMHSACHGAKSQNGTQPPGRGGRRSD